MENKYSLDGHSVKILKALQEDGRLSVQELSTRIGLSNTPTWKRVKDMEAAGVIHHYSAVIDRDRVGLKNCVLAEVNLARHVENVVEEFEKAVQEYDAITECYATTGQADYLLKILTPDISDYDQFLHNVIFKLPGVSEIRSSVVLREIKRQSPLLLDHF